MKELEHDGDLHFGMYTGEDLFMNLAKQEANCDMAKLVMDEVLSSNRLIEQIMERGLLPDLCSLLRRALGMSRRDNTKLTFWMHNCYNVGKYYNESPPTVNADGEILSSRTYTGRVHYFAYKVAYRFRQLRKVKAAVSK